MHNIQGIEEHLKSLIFSSMQITPMSQQSKEAFAYLDKILMNREGIHWLHLKIDTSTKRNTTANHDILQNVHRKIRHQWFHKLESKKKICCNNTFHIVNIKGPTVLGLPLSEKLNLFTLDCAVKTGDKTQHIIHKPMTIKSVDDLANL